MGIYLNHILLIPNSTQDTKHAYPIKKTVNQEGAATDFVTLESEDPPPCIMCIGLKIRCNDCQRLTKQVITIPCKAGSRHRPGSDLRRSRNLQCNGSGCVDYTERTIQNCVNCYWQWREDKIRELGNVQQVLQRYQRELEAPWQPDEDDETSPNPVKARRGHIHRLKRADAAIALQIVRRQLNGLRNQRDNDTEPDATLNMSLEVRT